MEYDLKKDKDTTVSTVIVSAEILKAMGVKPTNQPTKEDLEKSQRLIAGGLQLMYNRYTGQQQPGITEKQFEQWKTDARTFFKLVGSGYKSYQDFFDWMDKSINIPFGLDLIK